MDHKRYQSKRIRQQMDEYLARGGRVRTVPPGTSGADEANPRRVHQHSFTPKPPATRTPLPEVVAAIEARKKARKQAAAPKRTLRRQPRRRMVYDDFGEPLRWEWVDD
ncbi:MAG: hypothetical protein KDH99_06820 [Alcanivoracaceae bacterium]|nr:hypothetical protein [Alcanivoracaceae bacterium]